MHKLLKCARIYRIDLPTALADRLAQEPAVDLLSNQASGAGFIPTRGEFVATAGGYEAFTLKHQAKVVPGSALREETRKAVAVIEEAEGRRVGRKETRDIRDGVLQTLLAKALIKTTLITAFYNRAQHLLFVPAAGKNMADTFMHTLIKACGAVEATTIYFTDMKAGLTTRMQTRDFGEFQLGGMVKLQDANGKRTFDLQAIDSAEKGIVEAIQQGANVTEIELVSEAVLFRLTSDFVLKRITFAEQEIETPEDVDEDWLWRQEVVLQIGVLTRAANALCAMFDDLLA